MELETNGIFRESCWRLSTIEKIKKKSIFDHVRVDLGFYFRARGGGPVVVSCCSDLHLPAFYTLNPAEILGKVAPTSGENRWRESRERDDDGVRKM